MDYIKLLIPKCIREIPIHVVRYYLYSLLNDINVL